jgi:RNA polymerase sigma-70 factor, ECF subfamily
VVYGAYFGSCERIMTQTDIHAIVLRATQGNRDAVAQLYELYAAMIYRYVAYRVSDRTDAEDLTAEIFVKMIEGLPRYRLTGAPFEAWLYRIASARVVDYRRRSRIQYEIPETLGDNAPTPEEQLQDHQEIVTLRQALTFLSEEQQEILLLRFIERKSHQEVADIVGKSVTAVKSIQHRALIELTARLGSEAKVRHYLRGGSSS